MSNGRYQDGEIVKDRSGDVLVYDVRDDTFYPATREDINNWRVMNSRAKPRVSITGRGRSSSRDIGRDRDEYIPRMDTEAELNAASALGITKDRKKETVEKAPTFPDISRALKTAPFKEMGDITSPIDNVIGMLPKSLAIGTWIQTTSITITEDIDIKALKLIIPNPDLELPTIPAFLEKALIDVFNDSFSVKIKGNLSKSLRDLNTIYGNDPKFTNAIDSMIAYLTNIGKDELQKGETITEEHVHDIVTLPLALAGNVLDCNIPLKGMATKYLFKNIRDKFKLNKFVLVIDDTMFEVSDITRVKYADTI